MKNILTVMKKEFARFFGDKRMIMMIVLPAILIYVIYSFMGSAMENLFAPDEDYSPQIYAVNMPDSIAPLIQHAGIGVISIEEYEVEGIKTMISEKEAELCIVFPDDFDIQVASYDAQTSVTPAPNIKVYYNSTVPNSSGIHMQIIGILDAYEASFTNKFDVNREIADSDLATAEDLSASILSSLLPMLLLVFMNSGCMGLAPESIAGEKERGTLATLLVTPMKRSELAIGKILSLATLSFLSGLIMALATILSLPKLMSGAEEMIDAGIYGATDYAFLALVILSTILLLVTLISIVSAFAKSVKEANTSIMPLMIVVLLVGVTGMFGGGAQSRTMYYMIPLYNSVQSMSGIFSLSYSATNIIVSCLSNLVYACAGSFALTKMFNSEKVMFSR